MKQWRLTGYFAWIMVCCMSEKSFKNPFVFVVGCPRSGTTLLQRMLDAHPEMTIANDTHFITRAAKRALRKNPNPELTAELLKQVESYRRFYRMGLESRDVHEASQHCSTYSEFVSSLYNRRAELKGKTISGEKTPDYCRQMPVLSGLFPRAKFIHIIRDGRDTTLSTLDWATETKGPGRWSLWATDPVGTCALWWKWQAGSGHFEGQRLGKALYHELKYEDLVADPTGELKQISEFLQILFSEKMARFYEGKTRTQEGLSAKSAWIPPTSGLRNWKAQMSDEDVAVFDGIAGDFLDKISYERRIYKGSQAVKRRIDRCLAWWTDEEKHNRGSYKSSKLT